MDVRKKVRIGIVVTVVFFMSAGVALSDGVNEVWKAGGTWFTNQVLSTSGIQYQAITRDGTRDQTFVAARVDGGVDIHDFNGVWGTVLQVGSPVVYTALDAWNKEKDYLATRADGGFDEIFFSGSWSISPITIDANTIEVYQAVAVDDITGGPPLWEFFAARVGGGMDMFTLGGGSWSLTGLTQVGLTEYVAMTSDINETRKYYAAKASGGIDLVTETTVGELPGTAGLQYVSLAADKAVDDRLYGVKPDGSIESISLSGGTWLTASVSAGSALYVAVDTRANTDDLYAVKTGGPVCGDPGTLIFSADSNQDCYVNLADLSEFVNQWLQCSDPNDPACQHQGPGPINSFTIPEVPVGGIVVDGNLGEWPVGSEWIVLNKLFFGSAVHLGHDILEARFTARWDGSNDKIYVAVIIDDNDPNFTDAWTSSIASDRIEIYSQGDAAGGQGWTGIFDVAQQYVLGPDSVGSHWAALGTGSVFLPDMEFESAVTVSGTQIIYECAVKQLDNYGTISGGSTVVTQLQAGMTVGFDVVLGTRYDAGTSFMMLAENNMLGKFNDADQFQQYKLISP